MSEPRRPILSLRTLVDPDDDRSFELAAYDVLLPCRRFQIDHKVAVLGRVSLTAEFLLRLVRAADGIQENDAASFFGFDRREMSFVLSEVESLGYIERRNGCLWLTSAGMGLFRDGSAQPEIFEVESNRESFAFDLISLAPQEFRFLNDFDARLPELKILDQSLVSSAAQHIPGSFKRFYLECATQKDRSATLAKRSLYSIDNVAPGERFFSPVRVVVRATGLRPWAGEVDLSEWRPEQELLDRPTIVDAASAFIGSLTVHRQSSDAEAYHSLTELAPEFLKEFIRKDGLAVERYYREAYKRVGEVRADRPTIPTLGSLLSRESIGRLADVLSYAARRSIRPSTIIWAKPHIPHWGATRTLPETLKQLKTILSINNPNDRLNLKAVCLAAGRPDFYLEKAFDEVCISSAIALPGALEVLLVPGLLVALVVHAPIGSPSGTPVPLGVMSFDPRVVGRAHSFIADRIRAYAMSHELSRQIYRDIAMLGEAESASS
jgi:hypothetical protein